MVAFATAIALSVRDNLRRERLRAGGGAALLDQISGAQDGVEGGRMRSQNRHLLRIPPFPGAMTSNLARPAADVELGRGRVEALVDRIRKARVGGTYWAAQPRLSASYVLARTPDALATAKRVLSDAPIVLWSTQKTPHTGFTVTGDCDPWHMLSGALGLFTNDEDNEILTIAAILGVPTYVRGKSRDFELEGRDAASRLQLALRNTIFTDPFTGTDLGIEDAIELCSFWRNLIDSNRPISCALGFAFWKRENVAPLLWSGSGPVRFDEPKDGPNGQPVAIWRSKVPNESAAALEHSKTPLIEVEDGFLRSKGLGADCVPPLSITVDRLGPHFDPSKPSELENLLQFGVFSEELLGRARSLREVIVNAGLGKYEAGGLPLDRPARARRHILVPGQVEDDRSVLLGGCGLNSNIDLLVRVRKHAPDAFIIYKPHPDVIAGHRNGSIPERMVLQFADEVVIDQPIVPLIQMCDEVHVNTSLAGFEALMREKLVTTYGVPFYAGWGLTTDLGPVPARRSTELSLDELVAAVLLLYPRYLDPVTGLPCPAETVVRRLVDGSAAQDSLVVSMRRIQGKVMRRFRELVR